MQKLFELTSKDFLTGLSASGHMPSGGLFIEAAGINPFRNAYSGSYDIGLLQTSSAVTETNTNVADNIIGGCYRGSEFKGYLLGDSGHFYEYNTSSYAAPTDLRSGTPITNPAGGVDIYEINGTKYLFYAQRTQIGKWDLSGTYPTGWIENYIGSGGSITVALQSTDIRPFHQFVGNLYYGNKHRIGMIQDNSTITPTHDDNALDIPSEFSIVSITDDGYYLVFAATTNTISGNLQVNTLNKIFFWDTSSNSWQKEYTLPVANIMAIRRVGTAIFALTSDGLYACSVASAPELLVPLSNTDTSGRTGGVTYAHDTVAVKNNVFYWINGNNEICAYGSPMPGMTARFFKPFVGVGTIGTYLGYPDKFRIVCAGTNSKLGNINTASGGATGRSAETSYINLNGRWQIKRIDIILGEPLALGDELNIDLQSDEDTAATDYGTMSYALDGAVRAKPLSNNLTVENLKMIFNFVGGNVKIKRICVYGEPINI